MAHRRPRLAPILIALIALVAMAATQQVQAQDAASWLSRMQERSQEGHYRMGFDAQMAVAQDGIAGDLSIDGNINFVTPSLFRVDFQIDMNLAGMEMAMRTVTVADGEEFWIEMDAPLLGGKQVMTGPVGRLAELSQGSSMDGMGGLGHDPIDQISLLAKSFDLKLVGHEEGKVTLAAEISPELALTLAEELPMAETLRHVTLTLDERHAMPLRMEMAGDVPFMTMNFKNYEFFTAEEVEAENYRYAPPQEVQVNELFGEQP